MRRSLIIVLGALVIGAVVFAGSFHVSRRVCAACMANPEDVLDWLRTEFHLDAAEMARIRQLHDGYLPQCAEMCERIAAKKQELEAELKDKTEFTSEAETKLNELAMLRAQCQSQMLRHFVEVSQAMPPEQGRRYLAEMRRLTLGLHEQVEQSMSDHTGHVHGEH